MTLLAAIEIALKSALLAGSTLILLRLLAARSAGERSLVAHLGLLAAVVVPLLGEVLPRWSLAGPIDAEPAAAPVASVASASPMTPTLPTAEMGGQFDPALLTAIVYAVPAMLLLLATAIGVLRLVALRRRATVLTAAPWLSALAHAQRRMNFKNGAALLVSDELASPVSWGLVRPTIVVNRDALAADAGAEAIIAHELAHVARFDWAKLLLARLATTLFWFNPLVWALARQCHQLREEAADDAVLSADVDNADYAALLVGAARHESRGLLLAANGVAPTSGSLHQRVTRVLDGSRVRSPAGLGWSLACFGLGVAAGVPLAAMTTRALPVAVETAPETERSMGPATAARTAPLPRRESAPAVSPAPVDRELALRGPLPAPPPRPASGEVTIPPAVSVSPLSARQAIALRNLGGSDEWLGEMRALGYGDASFDDLVGMAVQGVTPDFVREMQAAGYPHLPTEMLTAFRIHGVNARLAGRMTRRLHRRPTPEELVSIAILGPDLALHPPGTDADLEFDPHD